jgi:hypothetical protein
MINMVDYVTAETAEGTVIPALSRNPGRGCVVYVEGYSFLTAETVENAEERVIPTKSDEPIPPTNSPEQLPLPQTYSPEYHPSYSPEQYPTLISGAAPILFPGTVPHPTLRSSTSSNSPEQFSITP